MKISTRNSRVYIVVYEMLLYSIVRIELLSFIRKLYARVCVRTVRTTTFDSLCALSLHSCTSRIRSLLVLTLSHTISLHMRQSSIFMGDTDV